MIKKLHMACVRYNEQCSYLPWPLLLIWLNFNPSIGSDNGLAPSRVTSHYLNQCWPSSLTHICGARGKWVNDKMSAISQMISSCAFSWMKSFKLHLFQVSLKFVLIDNNPALVQIMAWRHAIIGTNADPTDWRIYTSLVQRSMIIWPNH